MTINTLLTNVPYDVVVAIFDMITAVLKSADPKRTAERHTAMIVAREASRAALRKALP